MSGMRRWRWREAIFDLIPLSDNGSNFHEPEGPESPFPVPEEWLDADESEDEDG